MQEVLVHRTGQGKRTIWTYIQSKCNFYQQLFRTFNFFEPFTWILYTVVGLMGMISFRYQRLSVLFILSMFSFSLL